MTPCISPVILNLHIPCNLIMFPLDGATINTIMCIKPLCEYCREMQWVSRPPGPYTRFVGSGCLWVIVMFMVISVWLQHIMVVYGYSIPVNCARIGSHNSEPCNDPLRLFDHIFGMSRFTMSNTLVWL